MTTIQIDIGNVTGETCEWCRHFLGSNGGCPFAGRYSPGSRIFESWNHLPFKRFPACKKAEVEK